LGGEECRKHSREAAHHDDVDFIASMLRTVSRNDSPFDTLIALAKVTTLGADGAWLQARTHIRYGGVLKKDSAPLRPLSVEPCVSDVSTSLKDTAVSRMW
jgi:hypothetical protein